MNAHTLIVAAGLIVVANFSLSPAEAQVEALRTTSEDTEVLRSWITGSDPVYFVDQFSGSCSVYRGGKNSGGGSAFFRGNGDFLLTDDPLIPVAGTNIQTKSCAPIEMEHKLTNKVVIGTIPVIFNLVVAKRTTCLVPIVHVQPFIGCRILGCDLAAREGTHSLTITKSKSFAERVRGHTPENTRYNNITGFPQTDCSK